MLILVLGGNVVISFENDYLEGAHEKVLKRLVDTNLVQASFLFVVLKVHRNPLTRYHCFYSICVPKRFYQKTSKE